MIETWSRRLGFPYVISVITAAVRKSPRWGLMSA